MECRVESRQPKVRSTCGLSAHALCSVKGSACCALHAVVIWSSKRLMDADEIAVRLLCAVDGRSERQVIRFEHAGSRLQSADN
jgi:nicotinamide mononucleotide (NMN) deamidase PncC